MKLIYLLFALNFIYLNSHCQTAEQREVIKSQMSKEDSAKSSETIKTYYSNKKERIDKYLQQHPKTPRRFKKNGRYYLLSDISSQGKPIYITQKRKILKTDK